MRLLIAASAAAVAAAAVLLAGPAMAGSVQTESESRKVFACRQQFESGTFIRPYYFLFDYQNYRVLRSLRPDMWMAKEMILYDFEDRAVFNEEEITTSQAEPEFAKGTSLHTVDASKKEAMMMFYIRNTFNKKSKEISVLRRGFSNWGAYGVAEDEAKYLQSKEHYKCVESGIHKANKAN